MFLLDRMPKTTTDAHAGARDADAAAGRSREALAQWVNTLAEQPWAWAQT
jgi:hypothetical protein